jgi:hypothetical protein
MQNLVDLRATVRRELTATLGIDPFVYENDAGALPEDPETASLREVGRSEVFVLVIDDSWGEITEREYDRARELNKPCFVYERMGASHDDPELRRFLKKLSGPRGVPSRGSFRNATDLADKIAKDVLGWLVREYRRLSAERLATDSTSQRASELQESMNRLSASTSLQLEPGNPSDLLAWQLRQWFEALEYPVEGEAETGDGHTDLVVKVPGRRRQTRTLVRATGGPIERLDVERAREARTGSIEEVWLVCFRRISPAAREAAEKQEGVFLYTLDELIEEDVNFDPYFDWLDEEVRKADIDRLYVPLAVQVNEVGPTGALHASSTYDDIGGYVDQWLEDTDPEHLSLLGEFGTGKSWFALKYAHDMVEEYRRAQKKGLQRPRLPLVIRLREYARGFKDVGALLTEFVFREHKIRIQTPNALETLNRMGRLLFIFDGFDEMAARVDQQKMVDNFWSLASILGPGSKAILTCRSEYFRFAQQAREVLGGKLRGSLANLPLETARFQVATLQMLDEARLRKVLTLRSHDQAVIDRVLANPQLVDLVRRPVMIDLLLEAMPNLPAQFVDLAQVYYQAVKRKMERDIKSQRTFTSLADKVFFLCEISWEMLATNQLKIHYKEMPASIRAYFGSQEATAGDEDYWRHDLLSQTMLVRDDDGYYHPAHKSLIEFFSAYKLSAAIGALEGRYVEAVRGHQNVDPKLPGAGMRWSEFFVNAKANGRKLAPLDRFAMEGTAQLAATWGRLGLNDSIGEMLCLLSGRDALVRAVKSLNRPGEDEIASRVLAAAASSGDLRGADLAGATLRRCKLFHCDLTGSDLSDSVWTDCALSEVSLDGAILRGASVTDTPLIRVRMRGADLARGTFSGVRFESEVFGAHWGSRKQEQHLLITLDDGRVAAVFPEAAKVVWFDEEGGARGTLLDDFGWHVGEEWKDTVALEPGVQFEYRVREAGGGEVELLDVTMRRKDTGETLFDRSIADPSYRAGSGTRALAVSGNGLRMATVSGKHNEAETAQILGPTSADDRDLPGFRGRSSFPSGPEMFDERGAAFSPDSSILAIRERPHSVGFWRTDTGAFLGRVQFNIPCEGCITEGASGLPEWLTSSNPGWRFETAREQAA